jgi:hypothetical protein
MFSFGLNDFILLGTIETVLRVAPFKKSLRKYNGLKSNVYNG